MTDKKRDVRRLKVITNFDPCLSSIEPIIAITAVRQYINERNKNETPGCFTKYRKRDRPELK